MQISRTSWKDLQTRIDPQFYHPQNLLDDDNLKNLGTVRLNDLRVKDVKISYGVLKPRFVDDSEFRLARIQNFQDPFLDVDSCDGIDEEQFLEYHRSECQPGDILIAIGGYVGRAAIVPDLEIRLNINQHIARLRPNKAKSFDFYFLLAYLISAIGQRQSNRYVSGSVQAGINLEDLREIPIPSPLVQAQNYIGDKVRQAERLRERSKYLNIQIKNILSDFALPEPPKGKTQRVEPGEVLDSLNPNAYMPKFMKAERVVRSYHHKSIKSLSKSVADGPFGSNLKVTDYKTGTEAEHPVIRVKNCENGYLETDDLVWINEEKQRELSRSEVLSGDLLVTKAGRIGSAAVYPEDLPPGNITSHLIRARLKHGINPYYVAEFLETDIGRAITERHSFKSTRPELTKTEIESCSVALLEHDLMEQVGELAHTRNSLTQYSKLLTIAAKLLVESLIEGKITELELQEAQAALQQGDTTLDRQILSRLTRKGIPARGEKTEEPPLFSDLDALYHVLSDDDTDEDSDWDSTPESRQRWQTPIQSSRRAAEASTSYSQDATVTLLDEEGD